NHNRTEDKKPSGLMLPPQPRIMGVLETVPYELETVCPTMVLDSEKMMEAFIGGLPQSIEGNVTTSKPQTLEEAINIAQRLWIRTSLGSGFLFVLSAFAMLAACASRAAATLSITSCLMVA
nr:reverse transcriptase domain-containing protein [Tanacetum cinerariifolium]